MKSVNLLELKSNIINEAISVLFNPNLDIYNRIYILSKLSVVDEIFASKLIISSRSISRDFSNTLLTILLINLNEYLDKVLPKIGMNENDIKFIYALYKDITDNETPELPLNINEEYQETPDIPTNNQPTEPQAFIEHTNILIL